MPDYPFQHEVVDGFFPDPLLREVVSEWPDPDWPHWFRYDSPLERKRACNALESLTPATLELLGRLRDIPSAEGLIRDDEWHGAGLHDMGTGEHLSCHLDADRHPRTGHARALNAVLLLCPNWSADWGGALQLWTPALDGPAASILPAWNRLVLFELSDVSYHSVAPLACPPSVRRMSLACFWWKPADGAGVRRRASFVRTAREKEDAATEELRRRRTV